MTEDSIRLNKFIAARLNLGRRSADDLIAAGRVKIDGHVASLGERVLPNHRIEVNGQILAWETAKLYVLMNKPEGYVCSRRQQGNTPTIYSLLPPQYHHLKTVGRLDKDSSGLIMLTNDGDLAHTLTHPGFSKVKKYEVRLNKTLTPQHQQIITDVGIDLPDGKSKFALRKINQDSRLLWEVTMREGRNRQIRRTFAALGYEVTRLHRIQFGQYTLDDLAGRALMQIKV